MLAIGLIHRCVTLEVKKMHTEGSPTRTSLYTSISLAPSRKRPHKEEDLYSRSDCVEYIFDTKIFNS